ncbi:MAG: methyltransferase domain-containing protein [Candidatus Binatia bacterium]
MEAIFKTIGNYSPAEIRELVRCKYSEVALSPSSKYKFRVGREYALDLGYPAQTVHALPEKMAEAFTGVSSFMARFEDFTSGGVVLELGSGGGFDTALLAERFGAATKVVGVDLSLDMVLRATRSLGELELSHVYNTQAVAEELPVRDNAVDWVVSNGIFNLSPEKERILAEIHRVLKPKGRVLCSEIVLYQEPSPEERLNEDDWFK